MSKTKIDIGFAGTPEIALEHLKKVLESKKINTKFIPVSYTHLRAHETKANLVCRLLLEKKKK